MVSGGASTTALAWCFASLDYGAHAGGVEIRCRAFNSGTSVLYVAIIIFAGAGFGTVFNYYTVAGLPSYYRIIYDASQNTTVQISNDGATWFTIQVLTGAQSGFASNAPSQFSIGAEVTNQSAAFAQIDWIKHV